jgi:predicted metal-dependent peptidase
MELEEQSKEIKFGSFDYEFQKANVVSINKKFIRFFGTLAYGLEKLILNEKEYLSKTNVPSLAYTDGRKIVFLRNDKLTSAEILFIYTHEVLHIISQHLTRCGSRNKILWNLACDHVVNRVCREISAGHPNEFKEIEGTVFYTDIHSSNPTISAESVYDILYKTSKITYISLSGSSSQGGESNQPQPEGVPKYKVTVEEIDKEGRKKITVEDSKGNKFETGNDTSSPDKSPKDLEESTEELIQGAKRLWTCEGTFKGDIAGNIVSYLDDILEVEVPWNEILESSILYYGQTQDIPSWTRKNIYVPHIRLPGYRDGKEAHTIVCAIDSSGSVSNDDLRLFIGVIIGSIKHYKQLNVLIHDVGVQKEFVFSEEPSIDYVIDELSKIYGRGGTSHEPTFKRIAELAEEELISTTVFLTDFYSDVVGIYKEYGWMKDIPSIWVLCNNSAIGKNDCVQLEDCETKTIHL